MATVESTNSLSDASLEQSLLSAYYQDIGKADLLTAEEEKHYSKLIHSNFKSLIDCIQDGHSPTSGLSNLVTKILFWQKKDAAFRPKQHIVNEILRDVNKLALQQPQCDKFQKFQENIACYCKEIKDAKNVLVRTNLCLVASVAKRYLKSRLSLSDLIQEGNLGLMRAAIRFDCSRGARFSSYAVWWIRQAITTAIGDKTQTIRIPGYFREQCNNFYRSFQELNTELGRKPNLQEISSATDMPMKKILLILETAQEPVSLETPINDEGNTLIHTLENENERSPYQRLVNRERLDKLKECFSTLTERQREILCLRFGLEGQGELTLQEIADKLQLSRERVRQAEIRAIHNIRKSDHAAGIQRYCYG